VDGCGLPSGLRFQFLQHRLVVVDQQQARPVGGGVEDGHFLASGRLGQQRFGRRTAQQPFQQVHAEAFGVEFAGGEAGGDDAGRPAPGKATGKRRGQRRLADAARSGDGDDPRAAAEESRQVVERAVPAEQRRGRAHFGGQHTPARPAQPGHGRHAALDHDGRPAAAACVDDGQTGRADDAVGQSQAHLPHRLAQIAPVKQRLVQRHGQGVAEIVGEFALHAQGRGDTGVDQRPRQANLPGVRLAGAENGQAQRVARGHA
jgi:hypothetical protein